MNKKEKCLVHALNVLTRINTKRPRKGEKLQLIINIRSSSFICRHLIESVSRFVPAIKI